MFPLSRLVAELPLGSECPHIPKRLPTGSDSQGSWCDGLPPSQCTFHIQFQNSALELLLNLIIYILVSQLTEIV